MICQICKNDGVLSSAGGNNFYYCRTCKIEIVLTEPQKAVDDELLDWDGLDAMDSIGVPYCLGGSKLISCGCMVCITRYS
jgi:hypothetical protein